MHHARASFDRQLRDLQDELLIEGSLVDRAIQRSMEALQKRDQELARQVQAEDAEINRRRYEIEERSLELIALQQPMAGDLRTLAGILQIANELERIGDYAKGNAKIVLLMGGEPLLKPLIDIPRMAEKGREMLRRALDAFVERDVELARRVAGEDDEVDALYNQVYRELLTFMIEDPRTIRRATFLLWASHNLERISDRVTNVCERVMFMVTGEFIEIDRKIEGLRVDN